MRLLLDQGITSEKRLLYPQIDIFENSGLWIRKYWIKLSADCLIGVEEIINLQPLKGGKAKAYQVKQVRMLILKYKFQAEDSNV